jgi:ABC-type histidine transport system ATPase subunit
MVNHVFFMYGGTIEAEGASEELFSQHSNPRLKQYLRAYGGGMW